MSRIRPTIILVRPREEGNIGSVARAMANMGLDDLLLVEPAPELGGVAKGFGVGGWHVLETATRMASLAEAVAPFRRVVGTTALRDRALPGTHILTPRNLPAALDTDPPGTPVALVFGAEDTGLRKDELELCGLVVRIPCARRSPTLNLAQAVLVIAYELFIADPASADTASAGSATPAGEKQSARDPPATASEVQGLIDASSRALERVGFDQPHILRSLLRDLRRLGLRSGASSHEVRVLWRVANRILQKLNGRKS